MNDNTILRIKVPAHLYESVKEQLTLTEAKNKPHYGAGMEVVKEKKMKTPKDGMKKMEEADQLPVDQAPVAKDNSKPTDKITKVLANPSVISALKALNAAIANKQDYARLLTLLGDKIAAGEGEDFVKSIDANPSFKKADQNLKAVSGNKDKMDVAEETSEAFTPLTPAQQDIERKNKEAQEKKKKDSNDAISSTKAVVVPKSKPSYGSYPATIRENVDPNLIAGILGLLLGSGPILATIIKQYKDAETPEEKEDVLKQASNAIGSKMSGNMEEKKEMKDEAKEKVEEKKKAKSEEEQGEE